MKEPWFRRKKYGYGWSLPATWQGWIVFVAYLVFIIWNVQGFKNSHGSSKIFIGLILPTAIFIAIIYLTSEKPGWRWGGKNEKK